MNNIIDFYKNYENGIENYMKITQKKGYVRVYATWTEITSLPNNVRLSGGTKVYNGLTDAFVAKNDAAPCIICIPTVATNIAIIENHFELVEPIELALIEEYKYYVNINSKSISATIYYPKLAPEQSEREELSININKWLFKMYASNKIVAIEPYTPIIIRGDRIAEYKFVTRYIRTDDGSYAINTKKIPIIIKIIKD